MIIRKTITAIPVVLLASLLLSGCAHYSTDVGAFMGIGIQDLEKARKDGKVETFPIPFSVAFDEVTKILKDAKLTIYESSKKKGYIVAMGFHKQINTTRVGIFFESISENRTRITLSSLSSTALEEADAAVFGGLTK
ncbi:MAG: hypothetical protein WBB86_08760 [Candidatus Omnitrophota bacterium]